jgi:hypothetical protein
MLKLRNFPDLGICCGGGCHPALVIVKTKFALKFVSVVTMDTITRFLSSPTSIKACRKLSLVVLLCFNCTVAIAHSLNGGPPEWSGSPAPAGNHGQQPGNFLGFSTADAGGQLMRLPEASTVAASAIQQILVAA